MADVGGRHQGSKSTACHEIRACVLTKHGEIPLQPTPRPRELLDGRDPLGLKTVQFQLPLEFGAGQTPLEEPVGLPITVPSVEVIIPALKPACVSQDVAPVIKRHTDEQPAAGSKEAMRLYQALTEAALIMLKGTPRKVGCE